MQGTDRSTGLMIGVAITGLAAAVVLAAWLGNWSDFRPTYDTFTHDGVRLAEVESSLAAADEKWAGTHRAWVESGDAVDTSSDSQTSDSRCYLQVWKSAEVAEVGLCGPFRSPDNDDLHWATFDLHFTALVDGTVQFSPQDIRLNQDPALFVEPSTHDEINAEGEAVFYSDTDIVRADGRVGDRDQAVAPPLGWPRTVEAMGPTGDLMSMTGGAVVASEIVRLYGHDYRVEIDSVDQLTFRGEHTYVPAPGGGLVNFRIAPAKPHDTAAKKALARAVGVLSALSSEDHNARIRITFEAQSGGETFTSTYAEYMTEWRGAAGSGGGPELISPSAMLQIPELEGATYAVVVDGHRHQLEASR